MHGARRKETILNGKDHPQFTFGNETREKRTIRAEKLKELKKYADILKRLDRLMKNCHVRPYLILNSTFNPDVIQGFWL